MTTTKKMSKRQEEAAKILQLREEQLNQINEIVQNFEKQLQELVKQASKQLLLLESVSQGLYDELDKLSKKSPIEPITDLMLTQINDVIRETRQLVKDDSYIQRINEFVPAGDNPETRDALIVLRQVRQGLNRFRKHKDELTDNLRNSLKEAEFMQFALETFVEEEAIVDKEDFKKVNLTIYSKWLERTYPQNFDFEKLDNIDIAQYFNGDE